MFVIEAYSNQFSLKHLFSDITKYAITPAILDVSFPLLSFSIPVPLITLSLFLYFQPFLHYIQEKILTIFLYFQFLKNCPLSSFYTSFSFHYFLPRIIYMLCSFIYLPFYWKHSSQNDIFNSVAKLNRSCAGCAAQFILLHKLLLT